MTGAVAGATGGVQELAEVVEARPVGAYTHLVLHAPEAARRARPGQFVACGVGDSGMLLRRSLSLHAADPAAGTLEVVVAAAGPGTRLLAGKHPGEVVPTTAPLGRPFPLPFPQPGAAPTPAPAVVIGGGYGAAPLPWLARELVAGGSRVVGIVGAASADRLLGTALVDDRTALDGADGCVDALVVTTDDGSLGAQGRVTDALPEVLLELAELGTPHVYACGPMPMLRAVHETTRATLPSTPEAQTWLAVEESMACGVGVCMTCVLPVIDEGDDGDGLTRMLRACTAGPVFAGDALRWDAIGADPRLRGGSLVPADAVGAPQPTASTQGGY